MKVLVVGGGGREHALAWKLAQDRRAPDLFCAPGNAGTAACATNVPVAAEDADGLLRWARTERPDLTVVGPEAPLCVGIVDRFAAEGLRVFGPVRDAARLEGSKIFAKEIMQRAGIPTADAKPFRHVDAAMRYVRARGLPLVVKADGLAGGKGVAVCRSAAQAEHALRQCLERRLFGAAGATVLVEECLQGEEVSVLGLIDGQQVVLLASCQDHKAVFDGDRGPNTGGMGAYSPAPVVGAQEWGEIRTSIFQPVIDELARRGIRFQGVLYTGLMKTEAGLKVLEFNVRFGDPECQALLPRWAGDLIPALEACIDGTLREPMVEWSPEPCVCVVMASGGYPGAYEKGLPISGLEEAAGIHGVQVFHAGTDRVDDQLVTAGGRVLSVTAVGEDLNQAIRRVYRAVERIRFANAHFRTDIGSKALKYQLTTPASRRSP